MAAVHLVSQVAVLKLNGSVRHTELERSKQMLWHVASTIMPPVVTLELLDTDVTTELVPIPKQAICAVHSSRSCVSSQNMSMRWAS